MEDDFEMSQEDLSLMNDIYKEIEEDQAKIEFENQVIIDKVFLLKGASFKNDLMDLIKEDEIKLYLPFEFVDTPKGNCQEEDFGTITEAWIDQRCEMEDSYSGTVTVKIKENLYLEMPFSC